MEIQGVTADGPAEPDGCRCRWLEQNRGRWEPVVIRRVSPPAPVLRGCGPPGPYVLQAEIAACHGPGGGWDAAETETGSMDSND